MGFLDYAIDEMWLLRIKLYEKGGRFWALYGTVIKASANMLLITTNS